MTKAKTDTPVEEVPETVTVEVPVPTNVDAGAFKESVDLKDTPDEDLSEEAIQRKHHPQWYSNPEAKSTDPAQAVAEDSNEG